MTIVKVLDGTEVSMLSSGSHKKIVKKCDRCFGLSEVNYYDLLKCRNKHSTNKDYCFKCSMIVYNSGDNNPSKRKDVREKISLATKGKSNFFKDGINPRILHKKRNSMGYILSYNKDSREYELEHRKTIEDYENRKLNKEERVHHIDGNKVNNDIDNLVACVDDREHQKIHHQSFSVIKDLLALGVVRFNKKEKKYYLNHELNSKLIPKSLSFNDIAILQNKNICLSRLETDTTSEIIRGINRPVPIMASNMSSVVNSEFCIKLYNLGALGVMHRALSEEFLIKEIKDISAVCDITCASIGLGSDQVSLCKNLVNAGANVIFIDVAHGYSDFVIEQGKIIKREFPEIKLVLGNCINPDMIYEIYDFADALKVGIANGLSCKTKNTASCNEGQFTSIHKFKELSKEFGIPIIGDGGIREPADFTKAIAAGANSVMAGSIFARCPESAADIVEVNGTRKKVYAGMASRMVQDKWKSGVKPGTCTEGKINYLDIGEPVEDLIERYIGALRSGITYAGAKDVKSFQEAVRFTKV